MDVQLIIVCLPNRYIYAILNFPYNYPIKSDHIVR